MNEEWKEIDENYSVSNIGRVKLRNGRITHGKENNYGYLCVSINRKNKLVSRLVAQSFIPNPYNLATVNHKNEIKKDNRVENLEWLSIGDNSRYSFTGRPNYKSRGRKLTDEHKEKIRIASLGRIKSDETKLKLSLSNMGHSVSDETRKKISEKNKGNKMPDDAKEKIREKQIILTKDKKRNEKGQFV